MDTRVPDHYWRILDYTSTNAVDKCLVVAILRYLIIYNVNDARATIQIYSSLNI